MFHRPLSLLTLLFALLSGICAASTQSPLLYLITIIAFTCAYMVWTSVNISHYLRIFVQFFAFELVVTGLCTLAANQGLWPNGWEELRVPETLPISVGMFAILCYGLSYVPVVRMIMGIADRYFDSDESGTMQLGKWVVWRTYERRVASLMLITLVLINQFQVAITLRLSFFNRDWFNALQEKDAATFWRLLFYVFTPWAFVYITSYVIEYVIKSMLVIRWRRWLTTNYINRWLTGSNHYLVSLEGKDTDNPDQRIAEDVYRFIEEDVRYGLYSYSIILISTLASLVSFSILLWSLSSQFPLPGTDIVVPGLLFWVALVYAALGTIGTHLIGRVLVPLYFLRQKFEANFRFALVRIREYTEQIALLRGEGAEQAGLLVRFGQIIANYLEIVKQQKRLIAFIRFFEQLSPIIPYLLTAPFYFLGKITLGVMTQTAGAFGRVQDSLNFFVNYYTSLADFRAVVERLRTFDGAIDQAERRLQPEGQRFVRHSSIARAAITLTDVRIDLPTGVPLLHVPQLSFRPGDSVLLMGPSGCGKSTFFRVLSGIWPYGEGALQTPIFPDMMVLPQKPYLPMGTLKAAMTYPRPSNHYAQGQIEEVLEHVGLGALKHELEREENWSQRLSGGEQQRVAWARAMLAQPAWLMLDEASSALDERSEAHLYGLLKDYMPNTTYVSVGHRTSLKACHAHVYQIESLEAGGFELLGKAHEGREICKT